MYTDTDTTAEGYLDYKAEDIAQALLCICKDTLKTYFDISSFLISIPSSSWPRGILAVTDE